MKFHGTVAPPVVDTAQRTEQLETGTERDARIALQTDSAGIDTGPASNSMSRSFVTASAFLTPPGTTASAPRKPSGAAQPTGDHGRWTDDEEARLWEQVQEKGRAWTAIATEMPPWSDNQVKNRWCVMYFTRSICSARDHAWE